MSEDSAKIITEQGTLNALGVDIKISDIIGERIVDQWMAQLTPEDMNLIFKAVENEIFEHDSSDNKYFKTTKTTGEGWSKKVVETPIWKALQQIFAERFNKIIIEKAEEILSTEKFQQRADQIAEELVEYATNGYKEDLKNRIRERLVNNVVDTYPVYGGLDLRGIIQDEISNYIGRYSNN